MFMSLMVLMNPLISLLTLALLVSGLYIGYGWYKAWFVGTQYIIASALLLLFTFFGKYLVLWVLSLVKKQEPPLSPEQIGNPKTMELRDGTKIYTEQNTVNDRDTVILVHGWGLDHTIWKYFADYSGNANNLVVFDLAGQGKSSRSSRNDYSLGKYADDLKELLDATPSPVTLVGHSIGGMIILTFCKAYPEYLKRKVKKIVLVHTTYTDPTKTSLFSGLVHALKTPLLVPLNYLSIVAAPIAKINNWLNYRNGMLHVLTAIFGFGGSETVQQIDYIAKFLYTASPSVNARGTLAMFNYDAYHSLSKIDIPVLVVTGDKDKLTKKEAGLFIQKNISGAQLLALTEAGHMGFFEKHDEFNAKILDFIRA